MTNLTDININKVATEAVMLAEKSGLPWDDIVTTHTEVLESQNTTITTMVCDGTIGDVENLSTIDWTSDGDSTATTLVIEVNKVAREPARPGYLASEMSLSGFVENNSSIAKTKLDKAVIAKLGATTLVTATIADAKDFKTDTVKDMLGSVSASGLISGYSLIVAYSYYLKGLLVSAETKKTNNETVFTDGQIDKISGVKVYIVPDSIMPTNTKAILVNKAALGLGLGIEGEKYKDADTGVGITDNGLPLHLRFTYSKEAKKYLIDPYFIYGTKENKLNELVAKVVSA